MNDCRYELARLLDMNFGYVSEIPALELADRLISHGVVVPPVQVGQTVYLIRRPWHHPAFISEEIVERVRIEYTEQGLLRKFGNRSFEAYDVDLGETVFITKEEAEKVLGGGSNVQS